MLAGSMVALVTPMETDGSVSRAALERLIEFHIQAGSDAIVSVGTTGESATLNHQEHCDVVRQTVELVAGRVPVIAGTGANSTAEAISLTECAHRANADACLLVTPYYNKPTQHGMYQHFKAIAEAVPIPQILYNVPGRTAIDLHTDTVARLAEIGNIVGIKDATGDMQRAQQILQACGPEFGLYSGEDVTTLELLMLGGHGTISVAANVVPKLVQQMCALVREGDRQGAVTMNDRLQALYEVLFIESNPIPVKWALQQMGLIAEGIRLPLTPLSPQCHSAVRQVLQQLGCLPA